MTKAYFDDSQGITVYCKDSRDMCELADNSIDLIATDPPYGISFMGKDWDTFNEVVPPQGAYQHKKGFKKLPRQNTASLTEFFVPIWGECLRVLKPGAFAFVMCAPRQDVLCKQILSLQEAGFNMGFSSIYHAYASGFPKAQNIGKAVDKRLGAERGRMKPPQVINGWRESEGRADRQNSIPDDKAITPQAVALDGSYAGFQPKPAVEVILVVMKPLSEKTYVDQALKNQKGVTWLDDGRIPYESEGDKELSHRNALGPVGRYKTHKMIYDGGKKSAGFEDTHNPSGRFPANLLVSDDVLDDGGVTKSEGGKTTRGKENKVGEWGYKEFHMQGYGDSGSFSRYFDLDKWWQERIKQLPESVRRTFPFLIVPKASKSEKNKGLDYEPAPIQGRDVGQDIRNVPYKARVTPRINQHPTVKPLKLMSYLITLGSREGDTVVDPFIGTGTTAIACQILDRRCTGYEIKPEYCEIAKRRLSIYRQRVMSL